VSSSSDTFEVKVDGLWWERKVEMSAKYRNLKVESLSNDMVALGDYPCQATSITCLEAFVAFYNSGGDICSIFGTLFGSVDCNP
jgi:hypothetical protein